MGGRTSKTHSLKASADTLSPKRLMLLTALFVLAIAVILIGDIHRETSARQTETILRVDAAATSCANTLNIVSVTGESHRAALRQCHPKGIVGLFEITANGDIVNAFGATEEIVIPSSIARSISVDKNGNGIIQLPDGEAAASWRALDSGNTILAAAPKADIFARSPAWLQPLLLISAISLVTASLMAAFIQQSRAAANAATAVEKLQSIDLAFKSGRTGTWEYDGRARKLKLSRYILEPLGLGDRDRQFSLSELSALLHPKDVRTALSVITGDPSGIHECEARLRHPDTGWSRAYFRTDAKASRHLRTGTAIELSTENAPSPKTALAESRLKDAIESISEAFVLWDAEGKLVAWNRRFASIFHLESRELRAGLTPNEVAAIARVGNSIVTEYFSPLAEVKGQNIEISLPKDRWLHVSRRPTAEGGLVCVATNMTELKRRVQAQKKKELELEALVSDLQSSRRSLNDTMHKYQLEKHRAEEASRSKSEFLANMSHELRTPLNAINGFSEIMASELYGPLGDRKYKEYVSDILSSGQHLLELIDDVLDMSKIEAGKLTLEPQQVELERLLNECIRLIAKRAADADIELNISVAHAPAIWADQRAVKQVVLNLLSNALNFTSEGGSITLTAEADLDGVTVVVIDSGAGIARDDLERLGAPFEMVGDSLVGNDRTGSGLGLALSKSLMEMHGGILALASQPNKGTIACATFPRRQNAKVRLPQFIRTQAYLLTKTQAERQRELLGKHTSQAAE